MVMNIVGEYYEVQYDMVFKYYDLVLSASIPIFYLMN
jgi:hypothetical protein